MGFSQCSANATKTDRRETVCLSQRLKLWHFGNSFHLAVFKAIFVNVLISVVAVLRLTRSVTYLGRSQWPSGLRRVSTAVACWDCEFESRQRNGCLSVVSIVCCQVEVSSTGRSLVQSSPTDCGVCNCV